MLPGRVLLLRNPRARRAPSEAALREAAAPLIEAGWRIELRSTRGPGEASRLAAEAAADGCDAVVAAGGDGTVHEVVNGLAGTATAVGVVPAGTSNVWAREARVPRGAAAALAFLAAARTARIDVGRVTFDDGSSRRFLLMCSTGLDAEIVRRVGAGGRGKRLLGPAWYAAHGVVHALRAAPVRATIEVDGTRFERELLLAVAGNTRLYGGVLPLTGGARADDGLLDLCAFSGASLLDRARLAARALRGGLDRRAGDGVDYARGAEVRIEAERPLAVQADGEHIGETPVTIGVEPRALTVLLAPGANPLLGSEGG
jgi:YegS/Rv2252/BmrU family lipid kinase